MAGSMAESAGVVDVGVVLGEERRYWAARCWRALIVLSMIPTRRGSQANEGLVSILSILLFS